MKGWMQVTGDVMYPLLLQSVEHHHIWQNLWSFPSSQDEAVTVYKWESSLNGVLGRIRAFPVPLLPSRSSTFACALFQPVLAQWRKPPLAAQDIHCLLTSEWLFKLFCMKSNMPVLLCLFSSLLFKRDINVTHIFLQEIMTIMATPYKVRWEEGNIFYSSSEYDILNSYHFLF